MSLKTFEIHSFKNNLLPFIFHHITLTNKSAVLTNWHTNLEILYCLNGDGKVFCDTEYLPFKKDDAIIINSEVLHRVITESTVEYYCLIIGNEFCKENGINTDTTLFKSHITDKKIKSIFDNLASLFKKERELFIPEIKYSVLGLLIELKNRFKLQENVKLDENINSQRIKKITLFIKENYNQKLTLDEISKNAMINKYYLSHEFKKFTGQTVFEYLNLIRCKEVRRRIRDGVPIARAANDCGFESMSYFTRAYKKIMGVLPSEDKRII